MWFLFTINIYHSSIHSCFYFQSDFEKCISLIRMCSIILDPRTEAGERFCMIMVPGQHFNSITYYKVSDANYTCEGCAKDEISGFNGTEIFHRISFYLFNLYHIGIFSRSSISLLFKQTNIYKNPEIVLKID